MVTFRPVGSRQAVNYAPLERLQDGGFLRAGPLMPGEVAETGLQCVEETEQLMSMADAGAHHMMMLCE